MKVDDKKQIVPSIYIQIKYNGAVINNISC